MPWTGLEEEKKEEIAPQLHLQLVEICAFVENPLVVHVYQ